MELVRVSQGAAQEAGGYVGVSLLNVCVACSHTDAKVREMGRHEEVSKAGVTWETCRHLPST